MSLRHARSITAIALLLLSLAAVVQADVLWDQSTVSTDPAAPGIANATATGFGGFTVYSVNDITVGGAGWTINKITQYYSNWNFSWPSYHNGNLIVMPKTGALPVGAPPLQAQTTIQMQDIGTMIVMTLDGLSLNLAPGDYWITVVPTAPAGISGANLQWPAETHYGNDVASYDAGSWNNYYVGYDGAFMIEGTLQSATPTLVGTWGSLKALYR